MEERPYVSWELMDRFLTDVFVGYGVPREDAAICADVLLESDRRGIESHGCNRFKPIYIDRIVNGTLKPVTEIEILKETPTTVVMDAHDGMGMVASYKMMEMLIEKAKTYGMAGGAICNSTHYGIAGYISGSFGGINLEDIAAPRCFEIERKLKERCDIPIFHDDQHGTAIITLAGLTNALKVVGKEKEHVKIVISGAGAAAVSITKLLLSAGFRHIVMCDRKGAIYDGRDGLNWIKKEIAKETNLEKAAGPLSQMLVGADVFIGVSAPGLVTADMVRTMAKDPIIFACANPTPEIFPDAAKAGGAIVVATGRSDFPNQVNNVLAFPGVFRGAFDVRASDINEQMKMAAANALASLISEEELTADYMIPQAFDKRVGPAVAKAVAEAARKSGVARQ